MSLAVAMVLPLKFSLATVVLIFPDERLATIAFGLTAFQQLARPVEDFNLDSFHMEVVGGFHGDDVAGLACITIEADMMDDWRVKIVLEGYCVGAGLLSIDRPEFW
jgi:hypothetical protein